MHGNHDDRTRAPERGDTPDAARRFERLWWREALGGIAGAPGRLSRYRRLYSRMLADALDGRRDQGANSRQGE